MSSPVSSTATPASATTTATGATRPGGPGLIGGVTVSRVGYGAMQLHRLADDRPAAIALLRRAIELGIDHIDTAEFYGGGAVNPLLAEALRPEDGVTVVSKIGADRDPGGPFPMRAAQRPEELRGSVEQNLRSLKLEQIPVVNLRRMDVATRIPVPEDQQVDLDDQLEAMTAMRDEGLIGAFGLSSVTLDVLRRAVPAGLACVQNPYSLVSRDDEELLQLCVAEGIAWVPYFPLGGSVPAMPKVADLPEVQSVARSLGVSTSHVGLAWLLQHAPNVLLIPGTASIPHLAENVAAGQVVLDEAAMASLDASVQPPAGPLG